MHRARGDEHRGDQGGEQRQLERGGVENAAEIGPAEIEDDHLVNHGELEVGGRVVHRDLAGLGEQEDEKRPGDQDQRRSEEGSPRHRRAEEARHVPPAGDERKGREAEEESRLGERRDRDLAARPHALEARARFESGEY